MKNLVRISFLIGLASSLTVHAFPIGDQVVPGGANEPTPINVVSAGAELFKAQEQRVAAMSPQADELAAKTAAYSAAAIAAAKQKNTSIVDLVKNAGKLNDLISEPKTTKDHRGFYFFYPDIESKSYCIEVSLTEDGDTVESVVTTQDTEENCKSNTQVAIDSGQKLISYLKEQWKQLRGQ